MAKVLSKIRKNLEKEIKIPINPHISPVIRLEEIIKDIMQKRFDELGGERFFGPLEKKEFKVWYYKGGCLCYNQKKAFEIHGDIYKKWRKLGGVNWGTPDTDELPCSDGKGRYNHFNKNTASIYWSPQTGSANCVYGGIRVKWAELGFERSYLGYPTSDEVDAPDGGRLNSFQHGGIYWWADTGSIDANDVVVQYTGLVCFKETSESSGSDEPYALFGIITPFATNSFRTREYGDVNSSSTRPDLMELYKGKPNGINISVLLMEHDEGDPNKYKNEITAIVQKAHEAGTEALKLIPVVGEGIAAVAGPLIQEFVPAIGQAINDLFGFGDDKIGYEDITLTSKQMLVLAKQTNNSTYKNVGFKFSTNNLRGEKANYKVYFGIGPV